MGTLDGFLVIQPWPQSLDNLGRLETNCREISIGREVWQAHLNFFCGSGVQFWYGSKVLISSIRQYGETKNAPSWTLDPCLAGRESFPSSCVVRLFPPD
jgi:hypothetical protein